MPKEDTQFKPGQSGNPAGRPKGSKSFKYILRQAMIVAADKNEFDPKLDKKEIEFLKQLELKYEGKISREQMMAHVLATKAACGNLNAINIVLDRLEGKPVQKNVNENTDMNYEQYLENLARQEDGE